ncbi:hypothetical protein [Synechococcus phage S-H1]|nr:hypothetical protein [Synechococcus phage S-H1]
MTEQHPITPPPELVEQWCYEDGDEIRTSPRWYQRLCAKSARWGADQELEACCKWLDFQKLAKHERMVSYLRAIRRPKPPSLKEQALAVVENSEICDHLSIEHAAILRRALESLPS